MLDELLLYERELPELLFDDEFDGIWACSSLLHVPMPELPGVLKKLRKALKSNGKLYVSFKYGTGTRQRGDRFFSDFDENALPELLTFAGFEVVECGITTDVRPCREDEKWINVIAKKATIMA